VPPEIAPTATLRAEIDRLADALGEVGFDLAVPHQSERRGEPARGLALARRYLLRRLRDLDAPLTVVVFGPTGAGKSTIVNSLAGRMISEPGALRPTTRRLVVWAHERNADRARAIEGDPMVALDDHPLLEHVTLVDTPDLDSYVAEHKELAESVLRIADAAVFVTTPQRYADAVPWAVVAEVVERRMPLIVVANRLSRRSSGAVADLTALLRDHGVVEARRDDVVQIQEHRLKGEGRLPKAAIERVREELAEIATDRTSVVARTVGGSVGDLARSARRTAAAIRLQHDEGEAFWQAARLGFEHQIEEIELHLDRGELVRSEVVARWQRIVGVRDLAALVSRGWARVQDIIRGGSPLEPDATAQVGSEARDELVDLVAVRGQRATTAAVTAWEIEPGARSLITPDLRRVSGHLADDVRHEVDEWLAGIVQLIQNHGEGRFRLARLASVGINGAATLLLLGVFASTGGVTGAEMGVAAGAAAAQQTVLEHIFGSAAAGRLAKTARRDLSERLAGALRKEAARFHVVVQAALDPLDLADTLDERAEAMMVAARELGYG
jgi:energy-coupling factor transporter ATP-binding protein EcfA2